MSERLTREYLRTFIANPTPVNMVLLSAGRLEDMKRIEDDPVLLEQIKELKNTKSAVLLL